MDADDFELGTIHRCNLFDSKMNRRVVDEQNPRVLRTMPSIDGVTWTPAQRPDGQIKPEGRIRPQY